MTQYNLTTANGSGLSVRTSFNDAAVALATNEGGATDPALFSPSSAFPHMLWADEGNNLLKQRTADNAAWVTVGAIKADGTYFMYQSIATLAATTTLNIGAANTNEIIVTGSTAITAFDTSPIGARRILLFQGTPTITHSTSAIILPNATSLTVSAGDSMEFISEGSGIWTCVNYNLQAVNNPVMLEESTGYGVISGLSTTVSGMTATVAAGIIHMASGNRYTPVQTTLTIPTADATNARIDLIYVSITGVVTYLAGTPSVNPVVPTLPTNGQGIANITVAAGATTGVVTDIRIIKYNLLDHSKNTVDTQLTSLISTFTKLNGFLGINGGTSGIGTWITDLGVRAVRISPGWNQVEQTLGVYNFSAFDIWEAKAAQYGEKLYLGLGENNTLYGSASTTKAILTAPQIAAHLNYVAAVANRYKGKGYIYSFWNEPDVIDDEHYGSNPQIYINIVRDMYNTIKSNDPTAIVCLTDSYGPSDWFSNVCELGLLDCLDAISIHLYVPTPEVLIDSMHCVRTIIRRYTPVDIPIYITEFGWSVNPNTVQSGQNTSEAFRAQYVIRYILIALYCRASQSYIYTTQTDRVSTGNNEDWFGILDSSANGGGQLATASTLSNFLLSNLSCAFVGRVPSTSRNDFIFKLIELATNYIKYVVWTIGVTHTIELNGSSVILTDTAQVISTTNLLDISDTEYPTYDSYSEPVKRTSYQNEVFNDLDNNIADGGYGHTEGLNNINHGANAHVEGSNNTLTSTGTNGHIEGTNNNLSGPHAHTEGSNNTASGAYSHVEGFYSSASGYLSHAENNSQATGDYSHAQGETTANVFASMTMGQANKTLTGSATSYSGTADALVIGNGATFSTPGNALRVTFAGATYGLSAFNSSGADYAEYFEWKDLNPSKEDRVGYFVTMAGEMIRKALSTDTYILGIISATPSVIGDSKQDDWSGKYTLDDWGRIQYRNVSTVATIDTPAHTNYVPILNSSWDSTKTYTPREERPEWDPVGMMGKLLVRDDGTCTVDGYCKSNDSGIATNSTTGYRVIKRVSTNIIQVVLK